MGAYVQGAPPPRPRVFHNNDFGSNDYGSNDFGGDRSFGFDDDDKKQ
jgi:hypothetical protein